MKLNRPELQYGLEIECVTLLDNDKLSAYLKTLAPFKGLQIYANDNPTEYKGKLTLQYDQTITTVEETDEDRLIKGFDLIKSKKAFRDLVDENNTVEVSYIEMALPPTSFSETMRYYKAIKKHLFDKGLISVNQSTGLHVNVSCKKSINNLAIDELVIATNFPDKKWLKKFNRESSIMCESISEWIAKQCEVKSERTIKTFMKKHKFFSVAFHNFINAKNHGTQRIEYRMMGGKDMLSDEKVFKEYLVDIQQSVWKSVNVEGVYTCIE